MPDGLQPSHLAVNSEQRARRWEDTDPHLGPADAWNWAMVARVMRRVSGWIRRRSVGNDAGRPILEGAAHARREGTPLRGF